MAKWAKIRQNGDAWPIGPEDLCFTSHMTQWGKWITWRGQVGQMVGHGQMGPNGPHGHHDFDLQTILPDTKKATWCEKWWCHLRHFGAIVASHFWSQMGLIILQNGATGGTWKMEKPRQKGLVQNGAKLASRNPRRETARCPHPKGQARAHEGHAETEERKPEKGIPRPAAEKGQSRPRNADKARSNS